MNTSCTCNYYDTATDAIVGLDQALVFRLKSDIKLATQGVDDSQTLISGQNHLPWDRAFAAGFDAEQRFLKAAGLDKLMQPRTYSGQIDPNDAIQQIQDVADGKSKDNWTEKPFATPSQAVAGIGVALDEVYARQQRAIKFAVSDLGEPPMPKDKSIWDDLLEILIKTALAGAAGAIGSMVSSAVKGKLEKALAGKAEDAVTASMFKPMNGDYHTTTKMIRGEVMSSGAAANTMMSEAAKDAFKEFFKSAGYKAIMSAFASSKFTSNSHQPLNIFQQHSEVVLDNARLQGRTAFVHLAPALGQAEPEPLHAVYQAILGKLEDVHAIQYDFVMQEWQNFKARAYHGVAKDHSDKDKHLYDEKDAQTPQQKQTGQAPPKNTEQTGSDANVGDQHNGGETGALLIEATIITDDFIGERGSMEVTKMRLPGAEDATLKHFRTGNKKLADVHMNKHYRFKFAMYMTDHVVNIGVGADHGMLESTVDKGEMATLRAYIAGDRVTNSDWIAAREGGEKKYDQISEKQILATLQKFIKKIENVKKMSAVQK